MVFPRKHFNKQRENVTKLEFNLYFVTFSPKILYIYSQLQRKNRNFLFNDSRFYICSSLRLTIYGDERIPQT